MKIESYALNMQGSSTQKSYHSVKEDLQVWLTKQQPEVSSLQTPQADPALTASTEKTQNVEGDDVFELSDKDKLKIKMLEAFIRALTGKDIKFSTPKTHSKNANYSNRGQLVSSQRQARPNSSQSAGYGLIYNRSEEKAVRTTVDFNATGVVKTSDGKEISFTTAFHVDQTLVESSQTQIRMGDALKDPLVINFDGPIPAFGDATFEFDLLADGTKDTLRSFSSDSAYLAIDKNGNGQIDDGTELFGPQTNNGFAELSQYDQDKNGWIDENDAVFNQLKLWSKDESGKDILLGLVDRNIGAIYLGHVSTGLDLYASTTQVGKLRDSGLVLSENGRTYGIQEVDVLL